MDPMLIRSLSGKICLHAGVFNDPLLVIGGDLNFTLSLREVWGPSPRVDHHRGFFLSFLEKPKAGRLRTILSSLPTWRNFRTDNDEVAKILDRFLFQKRC
jgi:hypothetical protein